MKYVGGSGQRWVDLANRIPKIIQCFSSKIVKEEEKEEVEEAVGKVRKRRGEAEEGDNCRNYFIIIFS